MRLAVSFVLLIWSGLSFAHGLDMRVRPQLPDGVATVADAVSYYVEPLGLRFEPRTPAGGDARSLAYGPARRVSADAPVASVAAAIQHQVGAAYDIVVDPAHGVVTVVERR